MKKTELQKAFPKKSEELLTTGKDYSLEISGVKVIVKDVPAEKEEVLIKASKDPIVRELLVSGKFNLSKYEQSLIYWPGEFSRLSVSSIRDCFSLPTPALATVKKYKGEFKTLALVCKFLEEVYSFFNVTNTLSDIQLQMTATLILEEYYFLTIADIRLCFFNAYKNKYGKLYNRLDGSIILDWLKQYTEERALEAQRLSEKRSSEDKSSTFSPEAAKMFRKLFDSVKDKGPAKVERIHYYSLEQYFNGKTGEIAEDTVESVIKELYKVLPEEYKKDMDFSSFRTWNNAKILFRLNKGGSLEEILNALNEGKI